MLDKARLGTRYVCYVCGTKFYDMTRPIPTCPDCNADQREAPVRDIKSLLSKGGGRRRNEPDFDELEDEDLDEEMGGVDDEDAEEDDDIGLLGEDEEEEGGGGEEMD
ncbi:MAG: FYDLN acid domain-containing protein [Myxococcota bacterium]